MSNLFKRLLFSLVFFQMLGLCGHCHTSKGSSRTTVTVHCFAILMGHAFRRTSLHSHSMDEICKSSMKLAGLNLLLFIHFCHFLGFDCVSVAWICIIRGNSYWDHTKTNFIVFVSNKTNAGYFVYPNMSHLCIDSLNGITDFNKQSIQKINIRHGPDFFLFFPRISGGCFYLHSVSCVELVASPSIFISFKHIYLINFVSTNKMMSSQCDDELPCSGCDVLLLYFSTNRTGCCRAMKRTLFILIVCRQSLVSCSLRFSACVINPKFNCIAYRWVL